MSSFSIPTVLGFDDARNLWLSWVGANKTPYSAQINSLNSFCSWGFGFNLNIEKHRKLVIGGLRHILCFDKNVFESKTHHTGFPHWPGAVPLSCSKKEIAPVAESQILKVDNPIRIMKFSNPYFENRIHTSSSTLKTGLFVIDHSKPNPPGVEKNSAGCFAISLAIHPKESASRRTG